MFILFVVLINSPVFERFSWDDSYLDLDTEYVTQSEVKLGVKLSNKKKIDSIKYTSSCGKVSGKGLEVVWDLSDVTGKCEITASYGLGSLKRILNVIPFDVNDELGLSYDKIDENFDDDLDFDGLTNKQEKEYKTNVEVSDTDLDGLDDYYEVFTSKTDPNKKDSDDDGLNDYDEIELELDPLKEDSKDDGIKDGERELNYNYENDKLKLSVVGKGNIASTISQVNSNTKISGKKGFIDNLYTLYMDGTLKEAILTIKYTDDELNEYGLDEDNLSIYFYDEKKSKYEKIDSKIDKENKTVTAKLKHFSNYVLGDSSLVKEEMTNEVLFILDNSWSMYTNEQYKEYTDKDFFGGYFESSTLSGSDKDGLRFSLTSDLAKKLYNKKFKIGLSEFRNDYDNAVSIGSNYNGIKKKIKSMKGKFITSVEGTNIGNALKKGIDEFSDDADNKYVVILTDGEDSSLSSNTNNIIEKAMGNSVRICSIGFGDGSSNSELSAISYGIGCKFYSAGDAMGLIELFDNIGTELDDDLVDVNDDGNLDGLLTADSGFIVNRDGFSFKNYGSNFSKGGHCYGIATFAQLYYKKVLPTKLGTKKVGKNTSYSYNFSNTYFNNYSDLYNYKLKTNALKYNFGFDTFGEKMPEDFRKLDGDTLVLNEKYKKK